MRKGNIFLFLVVCMLFFCSFDVNQQKVYDDAGLLTEAEKEELQEEAVKLADQIQMDVILVTTSDTGGRSTSDYNDFFYNSHSFGYEKPGGSGVQFLIDMEHHQFFLLTAGIGDSQYTDAEIEKIYDRITPAMQSGDYADACRQFLKGAKKYADVKVTLNAGTAAAALAGSVFFAAVVVFIMAKTSKRKLENSSKRVYMGNSTHMRGQRDQFTHTTVVRTPVPKPKENSSGGGRHSGGGSSGGGHSRGGGRSF
jgi:uncharacterized protein